MKTGIKQHRRPQAVRRDPCQRRSYAGEQGPPFRAPAPEPQGEPSTWREACLYLGISAWVVLTIILGAMTALRMGWWS